MLSYTSSQVIRDLQGSFNSDGIAYFYFTYECGSILMLQFCIVQLASQCRYLPSKLQNPTEPEPRCNNTLLPRSATDLETEDHLTHVLVSLLPTFRRTFMILDGLNETKARARTERAAICYQDTARARLRRRQHRYFYQTYAGSYVAFQAC